MAGRPKQEKANILALKKLYASTNGYADLVQNSMVRPIIVFTMRNCGCTFQEIADVFEITRQMAETIYKNAEKEL